MEHSNPLLQRTDSQKFITIGEIMLRLTPPHYGKIRVTNTFEASYGGSEANIALALANLGVDSTFFTVVPNNSFQYIFCSKPVALLRIKSEQRSLSAATAVWCST